MKHKTSGNMYFKICTLNRENNKLYLIMHNNCIMHLYNVCVALLYAVSRKTFLAAAHIGAGREIWLWLIKH